jgi:2-polyprenyl-6-hydroxyphenyl methylase/3-demethylubiquinone-9 3-methyltransferase
MTKTAETGPENRRAATGTGSADPTEIAKFTALADTWGALEGPFRPLHRFNPIRIDILKRRLAAHFGRDESAERPFEGLSLLDVGCGGGLIAEPMARLGFSVTGIDASEKNVMTAANHAGRMRLSIDYRAARPEDIAAPGDRFDAVLAL